MHAPFTRAHPFRRLAPRMAPIALGMAALLFAAQTVVALHGVVHLTRGDTDHCEIAQFAPSLSGCAPVAAAPPDVPPIAAVSVTSGPTLLRASEPLQDHPVRGPPAAA